MSSRCSETPPCTSLTFLETFSALWANSGSNKLKLLKFGRRRFNSDGFGIFGKPSGTTRDVQELIAINSASSTLCQSSCRIVTEDAVNLQIAFELTTSKVLVWIKQRDLPWNIYHIQTGCVSRTIRNIIYRLVVCLWACISLQQLDQCQR